MNPELIAEVILIGALGTIVLLPAIMLGIELYKKYRNILK